MCVGPAPGDIVTVSVTYHDGDRTVGETVKCRVDELAMVLVDLHSGATGTATITKANGLWYTMPVGGTSTHRHWNCLDTR